MAVTKTSRLLVMFASFAIVAASTSCGSVSADLPQLTGREGPYAEDIQTVLDSTASESVKNILSDFEITDEEYFNAKNIYIGCMSEAGIKVVLNEEEYSFSPINGSLPSDESTLLETACGDNFSPILNLFREMRTNPNKENLDKLISDCMKREGVAPDDYTANDYNDEKVSKNGLIGKLRESDDGSMAIVDKCAENPLESDVRI